MATHESDWGHASDFEPIGGDIDVNIHGLPVYQHVYRGGAEVVYLHGIPRGADLNF